LSTGLCRVVQDIRTPYCNPLPMIDAESQLLAIPRGLLAYRVLLTACISL
jgi:hypothetical protein